MDRGAWWVTIHGVTKNQTQLSDQHFHSISHLTIYHEDHIKRWMDGWKRTVYLLSASHKWLLSMSLLCVRWCKWDGTSPFCQGTHLSPPPPSGFHQ